MPPYNLSLDAKGYLTLNVRGGTLRLVEAEPVLLRDPNDADTQLVPHTDEAGRPYILSSDPWAYIKIPWYGTTDFRDLLVEIALLLALVSLIVWSTGWSSAALSWLLKRERRERREKGKPQPDPQPRPHLPRLARWVAALFGPVLVVMFASLDTLLNTKDPVFGYPVVLIDKPLTFYILMLLPYILAGVGLLMLVFTLLAWTRRYWNWGGRLHYTVLTISGLSVLWGMWYWNLLS